MQSRVQPLRRIQDQNLVPPDQSSDVKQVENESFLPSGEDSRDEVLPPHVHVGRHSVVGVKRTDVSGVEVPGVAYLRKGEQRGKGRREGKDGELARFGRIVDLLPLLQSLPR